MAIPKEDLRSYAELLVNVGAAVQPGQLVGMTAMPEHMEFVRAVTEVAYEQGARYVDVWYWDQHTKLHRVTHAPEDTLSWTPPYLDVRAEAMIEEKAALIAIRGNPDPDLLSTLDPQRVAKDHMPRLASMLKVSMSNEVNWTIGCFPTPGWAQAIYGEPDVDRLWGELRSFLRLDLDDPVGAWRQHLDRLIERAETMTKRGFDGLRYRGPGTDLFVGLLEGGVWEAARFTTNSGRTHTPNMPTEEVFTSPDRRRSEGTIRSTKPLAIGGTVVRDLEFTFENGRIVEARASAGQEVVEGELDLDENARSLGEVALVDKASPIGASGTIFLDTLLDENATSHIAYGSGFADALPDGRDLDEDQRFERGVNNSKVHTDFMVGGPEVDIFGVTAEGEEVPVIVKNEWRL